MATLSVGGSLVTTNDTLSNGVQDNITRLGTVASGVIGSAVTGTIGTGVTFPAGHVIQVKESQTFASQAFDADIDTITTVVMTNVLASSICICFWNFNVYAGTATQGFEGYVYRESTNVSSGIGGTGSDGSPLCFMAYQGGVSSGQYENAGGSVKDSSPGTGTVNYYLKGSAYSTNTIKVDHAGLNGLTVMEIAQ